MSFIHKLPNDLIRMILEKQEISRKPLKYLKLMAVIQPATQKAVFDRCARKF